jgi:hypothetical protein
MNSRVIKSLRPVAQQKNGDIGTVVLAPYFTLLCLLRTKTLHLSRCGVMFQDVVPPLFLKTG